MAWSYDADNLGTDTAPQRLNSVRFLVGDTDTNDQQALDSEITFALSQTGENVYYAASYVANAIAAKYSRRVTVDLDGALQAEYSDLAKQYRNLSSQLRQDGQRFSGTAFNLYAGGISISDINTNRKNPDRPQPAFRKDRFDNPYGAHRDPSYYDGNE